MLFPFARKVTVPVAFTADADDTVAVKVTDSPYEAGFNEEVTTVVVGSISTTSETAAEVLVM
jgi:hypothetical protein